MRPPGLIQPKDVTSRAEPFCPIRRDRRRFKEAPLAVIFKCEKPVGSVYPVIAHNAGYSPPPKIFTVLGEGIHIVATRIDMPLVGRCVRRRNDQKSAEN